jgi:hypothetical protein
MKVVIVYQANPCDDFVAWHYEKSGFFSVKSVYRLAYNLSQGTRWKPGNSHSLDNTRNIWKMFWNAKVPKKVLPPTHITLR